MSFLRAVSINNPHSNAILTTPIRLASVSSTVKELSETVDLLFPMTDLLPIALVLKVT
jgi:hypothetical protein